MNEQELIKQIDTARYSLYTLTEAYKNASPTVDKASIKLLIADAAVDLGNSVKEFLAG